MSEEQKNEMVRGQEDGKITYATEVIATIVSVATMEVEGISGITGGGGAISGIIGRGRIPRGVKVDVKGDRVSVDVSVTVDYGIPIQKVGRNCQVNIRKSIETMTGMHVEKVDLHVIGVSFEKEDQEMQKSQKRALTINEEEAVQEGQEEQKAQQAGGETAEEKAEDTAEENKDENAEVELVETDEETDSAEEVDPKSDSETGEQDGQAPEETDAGEEAEASEADETQKDPKEE